MQWIDIEVSRVPNGSTRKGRLLFAATLRGTDKTGAGWSHDEAVGALIRNSQAAMGIMIASPIMKDDQ